jgi:hypothetical protein
MVSNKTQQFHNNQRFAVTLDLLKFNGKIDWGYEGRISDGRILKDRISED